MPENKCVIQFDYQGNCCKNNRVSMTRQEFDRNFAEHHPEEVDVSQIQLIKETAVMFNGLGKQRVVYARSGPRVDVVFVGPCPNLDTEDKKGTFDCLKYATCPDACKRYQFDGPSCRRDRQSSTTTFLSDGGVVMHWDF